MSVPRRTAAAKLLTKDEARRIAANIAKLPELRPADNRHQINFINCASDLYNLGRAVRRFRCSSYFPIAPGILYKPVIPMPHRMIGILRCRGPLYPPFRKEHARYRVPLLA